MAFRKAAGAAAVSANDALAFDLLPGSIDANATILTHRLQTHFGLAAERAQLVASLAFMEVPR